jgi:hypothetical protein
MENFVKFATFSLHLHGIIISIVDLDLVGSKTFSRIRIRKKSCWIRAVPDFRKLIKFYNSQHMNLLKI